MGVQNKSPQKFHDEQNPDLSSNRILKQLQQILDSSKFDATKAQRAFLQYVIKKAVEGKSEEIKGYALATEVFGRGANFDQAIDPVVSIHANKLRRALERYYLTAGKSDPIRIDIPKGSYVPAFSEQTGVKGNENSGGADDIQTPFEDAWPSVMIRSFQNLTGDPEKNFLGTGLAMDLSVELSRYQDIRVLMHGPWEDPRRHATSMARFVIEGSVRQSGEGIRLTVYLIDTHTGTQIWGDTHQCTNEVDRLTAFEEEVARVVAAKTAGEHGIISRTLSAESRDKPPASLKTYEAILRYYEYDRVLTPASFMRALEALEHAVRIEPNCGQAWSMLGRIYGNGYSLELPGFETALEKAVTYAEKGVRLNPENQRSRGVLALVRMFSNETTAALAEAEKALILNPNSLFILDGIGYLLTLLGEWERGPALIRKVIKLNPYYGLYVHYALWTDWMRQQKYIQAHLEALNFSRPSVFWEPLMKASTFGHLGRVDEGKRAVENLLELKPNFPTRGRVLIKHYVKFDNILENMINGLKKVGLRID